MRRTPEKGDSAFAIATLKAFAVVLTDSLSAIVATAIRLATVGALLVLAHCRHGLVPRARNLPVSSPYLYMWTAERWMGN